MYNKIDDQIRDEKLQNNINSEAAKISAWLKEKTDFSWKKGPVDYLKEIKKGDITIEQAKASQKDFNNYLKMIQRGNKTNEPGNILANINRLFNRGNDAINLLKTMIQWFLRLKKSCRRTKNSNRT